MKKIILFLILGLIAAPAIAEITFVSSDTAGELITTTSPTSLTLSGFNAGTAADTYVLVAISTKLGDPDIDNPVTSVTFNGTTLTNVAEKLLDDGSYNCWAILYGGAASGTGDVVVNYTAPVQDDHDGITFSVASYSDVSGTGAVGNGDSDGSDPSSLTGSITTSNDNSLIISSVAVGAKEVTGRGTGGATVIQNHYVSGKNDGALVSLAAPTAGPYSPGVSLSGTTRRAVMISAELVEQAAPKATTFIVR